MDHTRRRVRGRAIAVVASVALMVLGLAAPPAAAAEATGIAFSPSHAYAGQTVTITPTPAGNTFTLPIKAVTFGGKGAFSFTQGTSSVSGVVPANAPDPSTIKLTDNVTTLTSATDLTVDKLPSPSISSISPTCGARGSTVRITGTSMIGADRVTFAGTSNNTATPVVDSPTEIHATVPTGAVSGNVTVHVSAAAGVQGNATSNALTFSVSSTCPTITSFTPTLGGVGTSVTITGTNFAGTTGVKFNLTSATFSVNSAVQITATVPAGATTGKISVTTPSGTATSANDFTVIAAPTITSFSPTSGPRGTLVTINGTNFSGTNITVSSVTFHGSTATFSVLSSTQLTATVPSNATTGRIKVTTAGGTATSSTNFTVTGLTHPRRISFSLAGHRVSGDVTATDGFAACERFVPVAIQQQSAFGAWRLVELLSTNRTGHFSGLVLDVSARYRAVAIRVKLASGEVCSARTSHPRG